MAIEPHTPLLLASGSPRRRELLAQLGIPLVVRAVDVDESVREGEGAEPYLERVVAEKLAAASALDEARGAAAVLVADTAVIVAGRILGKPRDDDEAAGMLRMLAGARHVVSTRFAIARDSRLVKAATVSTEVELCSLDEAQIARYVASGEGRDKAGAYAIQGVGGALVRAIRGSYSNVVGLPLCEVVEALREAGLLGPVPLP